MKQSNNFEIKPLSPYTFEFNVNNNKNRIDYYYLDGDYELNEKFYTRLKEKINTCYPEKGNYTLFSIYIYRKTDELNEKFDKPKEWLDGNNKDLIVYIRYNNKKNDIFFIINEGNVIYDLIDNKKINFEFEQ